MPVKYKLNGLSNGGVVAGDLTITGNLTVQGNLNFGDASVDILTALGPIRLSDGSAATPSLAFINDIDCGLYRIGANTIGWSTNGTEAIRIDGNQNVALGGSTESGIKLKIYGPLNIHALAGSDPAFTLSDEDSPHGMTSYLPTNIFLKISPWGSSSGGAFIQTASAGSNTAMSIKCVVGATSASTGREPLIIDLQKYDGVTGTAVLGASDTALNIYSGGNQLFSILGGGRIGLGTDSPSYPIHSIRPPVSGAALGLIPTSVADGDSFFYGVVPTVTGNILALNVGGAVSGSLLFQIQNTNSVSGTAHALYKAITNASGGDPSFMFTIFGVTDWTMGVDNSDSDKFKIASADSLGTAATDRLTITTGGLVGIGTNNPSYGLHVTVPVSNNIQVNLSPSSFADGNTILVGSCGTISGASSGVFAFDFSGSVDADIKGRVYNSNGSAANAHAHIQTMCTAGGGDAKFTASLTSAAVTWSWGLDNSDSDNFVFSRSINLGTNNVFKTSSSDGGFTHITNIGFFSTTPASQQVSGANLTNNVTSGGTDDTIENFTDLATYANDAAAIRNNIYQLARKLKQVNDALRTYGLLT